MQKGAIPSAHFSRNISKTFSLKSIELLFAPWIFTPSYGLVQLPKQLTKSFEGNRYLVFRLTSLVYKFSFPLLLALRNYFVNLSGHSAVQFFHRLSRNKTHCSVFFDSTFLLYKRLFFFTLYYVLCHILQTELGIVW